MNKLVFKYKIAGENLASAVRHTHYDDLIDIRAIHLNQF